MAAPILVDADVNLGMEASKALWEDPALKPSAIMWLYDEDASEWRFLIATEDVRKRGPQAAYLRVRNLLKNAGLLDRLPLRRVVVADPADRLVATVRSAIHTQADALHGLSFYECTFNNMHVAGMHIYLLNEQARSTNTSAKKLPLSAEAKEPIPPAIHS